MPKIIQISDTHIVPEGQLAYNQVDTANALEQVVETINRLLPAIGPVDGVVVTGDLTDYGQAEDYSRFKALMAHLEVPYRVLPGNHDNRSVMRKAFSDKSWMPENGPIQWQLPLDDFTVIGLDSHVPGAAHGSLGKQGLSFLQATLDQARHKPILLGFHHPPTLTGLHPMDQQNLLDHCDLSSVIENYEGPLQTICGHVHRATTCLFAGKICQTAPGTSHAVTLDLRKDAPNSLTKEPGGFLLHEWRNKGFLSHYIPVGSFDGPYPFN